MHDNATMLAPFMSEIAQAAVSRFHLSLNVSDLARSVQFYRVFLGVDPAKHKSDYAKFEIDDPPLVLSLIPGHPTAGGILNHVGLRLPNAEMLVKTQERLEMAGVRTQREDGVECCHSRQTKFWVTDSDQTLWELYVLHEGDDEDENTHSAEAIRHPNAFANDSARAARRIWRHNLLDGHVVGVPEDDNSLHELILEGSANLYPKGFDLMRLLTDAYRALRPGGEVRIHGLTADSTLKNVFPSLPGPAAAVQYVPTHAEVADNLKLVGFVSIYFEQLSEKAHFMSEGVALRELRVVARKPGHRPQGKTHIAIYLGPLASVSDDFGNTFPRGKAVSLNIHDWQALSNNSSSGEFLLVHSDKR